MFSLMIYFIHSLNSAYASIPISQLLPPFLPLGVRIFVLYLCVTIPALQIRSLIPFWHTSYLLSEHACYSLLDRKFPEDMCLFCLYLSTHSAQYDTDKVGSEYLLKEKTKDKLRSFVPGEEALLKV